MPGVICFLFFICLRTLKLSVFFFFIFFFISFIAYGYTCAEKGLEDPQARMQARGRGVVVGRGLGAYPKINSGRPVSPFSPLIESSWRFETRGA